MRANNDVKSPKKSVLPIVAEVFLILFLFLYLIDFFRMIDFSDWQLSIFGTPIFSSALLLFLLPQSTVIFSRKNLGSYGLTISNFKKHAQLAGPAIPIFLPATILFPLIAFIGTSYEEWLGAIILSIGFSITGVVMLRNTQRRENISETSLSIEAYFLFVGVLFAAFVLVYLFQMFSNTLADIVVKLIFVGFLEEFFFRGYVQNRLNDAFGRPFSLFNINFGLGLIVASVVFGLFHPLTVADATPWAWALWTGTFGLFLGFLREKSGAVLTPALVHAALILPTVFFSAS